MPPADRTPAGGISGCGDDAVRALLALIDIRLADPDIVGASPHTTLEPTQD